MKKECTKVHYPNNLEVDEVDCFFLGNILLIKKTCTLKQIIK